MSNARLFASYDKHTQLPVSRLGLSLGEELRRPRDEGHPLALVAGEHRFGFQVELLLLCLQAAR